MFLGAGAETSGAAMTQRTKDRPPTGAGQGRSARKHFDELLDQALEDTFPASDPVAVLQPAPEPVVDVVDEDEAEKDQSTRASPP
jgi:hypothetical protein